MLRATNVRAGRPCNLLFAPLLLLACGSDTDPLDTVGATTTMTGPVSGPTGNGASTQADSSEATTEEPGTATTMDPDPTTTGGPEPGREVCDRYLDCLAVTMPEALPTAQMGFGPMGTCWDGPPESIQQCIDACQTAFEGLHMAFPGEPKCFECEETADCPAGERCAAGSCNPPMCGDGIVDAGEICDYPEGGCDGDCAAAGCNPLTNAGCAADEGCQLVYPQDLAICSTKEPLPEGAPCPMLTDFCGVGHVCVPAEMVPGCSDTLCCTSLCNVQAANTCPDGGACTPYPAGNVFSNYLGVCAPA